MLVAVGEVVPSLDTGGQPGYWVIDSCPELWMTLGFPSQVRS